MGAHGHWLAWVNRWDQNGAYTLHISCDFNHSTIVLTLRYPYISNLTISNPDGSLTSSNTNISSTHALQPSCLPLKLEKWKKKIHSLCVWFLSQTEWNSNWCAVLCAWLAQLVLNSICFFFSSSLAPIAIAFKNHFWVEYGLVEIHSYYLDRKNLIQNKNLLNACVQN